MSISFQFPLCLGTENCYLKLIDWLNQYQSIIFIHLLKIEEVLTFDIQRKFKVTRLMIMINWMLYLLVNSLKKVVNCEMIMQYCVINIFLSSWTSISIWESIMFFDLANFIYIAVISLVSLSFGRFLRVFVQHKIRYQ